MNQYFENQNYNNDNFPGPAEYVECSFSAVDFQDYNMSRMKFIDCSFSECNFSNTSMKGVLLRSPKFSKSRLIGINWVECANFSGAEFNDCLLDYCVFQSLNLKSGKFIECKMHEVDFYEAQLVGADFSKSDLKDSVFNGADLRDADFRAAVNYFIDVRLTNIKKAKFSVPEAFSLLTGLGIIIE